MAMSAAQLRRLAAAEDQGSVAAGTGGVNAMLLRFDRQNDQRVNSTESARPRVTSGGMRARIYPHKSGITLKP